MFLWNSLRGSQKRDAGAFQGVRARNRYNVNSAKNRLEDSLFSPTITSHPRQHQCRRMLPFSGKGQKGRFGDKNFDSRAYRKHTLQGSHVYRKRSLQGSRAYRKCTLQGVILVPGAHGEVHLGHQFSVGDLEQSLGMLKLSHSKVPKVGEPLATEQHHRAQTPQPPVRH